MADQCPQGQVVDTVRFNNNTIRCVPAVPPALQQQITALQGQVAGLAARVTTAESAIAGLQTALTNETAARVAADQSLQAAINGEVSARIDGDQALAAQVAEKIQSASTVGWQGGNVVLPSMGSADLPLTTSVTIGSAGSVVLVSYNTFGWSQHTTATCTYYTRPTVDGVEAGTTAAIAHLRVNAFEGLSHTVALPNLEVGSHQLGVRVYSNCFANIFFWAWGGPAGVAAHGHSLTAVVIKP
jgi:hypothetical protein